MRPVLEDALALLEEAERARTAERRVSVLLEVYLELWRRHRDALRLSHRLMQARDPSGSAALHMAFVGRVVALLSRVGRSGLLRASPELAARTLATVAVPLLELYADTPGGETLFVDAMRGLLLSGPGRQAD